MSYRLRIQPRAKLQLALWWAENRSTEQAGRWLDGFEAALNLLKHQPERWPLARESELDEREIRQMTYGLGRRKTHRAVFEIRLDEVIVYAVRHLAQDVLTPDDLSEISE